MKVGVIVDNEYSTDIRVKREVRLLSEFGFEVYVLCLAMRHPYDYKEEHSTIVPLWLPGKLKNALYFFMGLLPIYERWWASKIKHFIKAYGLEVIHTHDLYMSKCVRKGIKKSGHTIPMILDLHENYPYAIQSYKWSQGFVRSMLVNPKRWLKKESQYLSFADRIIVLSNDYKNQLLNKYDFLNEDKMMVFPNVVDTREFDRYQVDPKVKDDLPNGPRVLYFGIVASRRGIFRTLDVCKKLFEKEIDFSLVIIGPVDAGDKQQFFENISNPVFENRLKYIPWIEISKLPSYLDACDIALAPFEKNPQHESGIANKIFQYMYGKLPIIASDCKPQQELIEEQTIGKVFTDDDGFAEALETLVLDQDLREKMGQKAYQVLMSKYHQDALAPRLKSLYEDLLIKFLP